MHTSPTMPRKLDLIQVQRGLFAVFVMLYHIRGAEWLASQANGIDDILLSSHVFGNLSHSGIDVFFAISGFIMVYITMNDGFGVKAAGSFIFRKAARVYPTWWLFLGLFCVLMVLIVGTPWHPEHLRQGMSGPVFVLKSIFLIPQETPTPVLQVGWTLVHEQYFYILFALLMLLPRRLLPICLAIWATIPLGLMIFAPEATKSMPALRLITHPMTLEFITGAFAGLAFLRWGGKFALPLGAIGTLLYIVMVSVASVERVEFEPAYRVTCFILPVTLMVYGAAGIQNLVKDSKIVGKAAIFGDWSFSLYLSHPLVLAVLPGLFERAANLMEGKLGVSTSTVALIRLGTPGITDNLIFITTASTLCILVGAIGYYGFERPVARLIGRARARKTHPQTPENASSSAG